MKIKKLLFVTHFDELRFDALRALLDLREADLDHVVLLNVIERKSVAMRRGSGYRKETEVRLREKANIRFIDWAETLFEEGIEVGIHIVVGNFAGKVIKVANTENVDFIVIGPEKKGHIGRLCSGSDISEIMRRSARPVLVHRRQPYDGVTFNGLFSKPLFAVNLASTSTKIAIEYIKSLGNLIKRVDIVYVAKEKKLEGSSAMRVQKTRKLSREKLELICEEIELVGITTKAHVYIGDVASEIHKSAKECGSTMVIIGCPEQDMWSQRWSSSIGRKITEKSVFPILLMPRMLDDN